MSTIATKIQFKLSGLFGKSGRYYEFRESLEVIVEQDELGNWIHWLNALDIFSVEPTREDSMRSLMQIMDEHFATYENLTEDNATAGALQVRFRLNRIIKTVY